MGSYNVLAHWNYQLNLDMGELRNGSKGSYFLYVVKPDDHALNGAEFSNDFFFNFFNA